LAESAYQRSLQISPEELSTQADLDKLIEATRKSFADIEDKTIPLQFVTGQLASVERRALNLAEPLERKLARMQAARTSSAEASKFALERADRSVEAVRGEAKDYRTEAESRRRFGIEQSGAAAGRAQTQRAFEETQRQNQEAIRQADRKFEEDKRQFGLDYAIKQRQVAVSELEAKIKADEKAGSQGITPETGAALQLVNELIPKSSELAGLVRTGRFTGSADKLKQLISNLSVNARKLIKGQGQVSDYEAKVLADSTNALGSGYFSGKLSEGYFEQELKKIRGVINANAGQQVSVKVTDHGSGQSKIGNLGREDIFDAASKGFIIEYQ